MQPIQNTRYKILSTVSRYWLPVILWAGLIFYFSSIPSLQSGLPGAWDFFGRKIAHISVYAILTFLFWRALQQGHGIPAKKALWLAMCLALLYACTDEFHQLYVPGREGRMRDVAIDIIGIVAAGFYLLRKSLTESS